MVKIKEGYVMTAREKEDFDRDNARPRKPSGRVDYYFKPQTKYPPRIYVFMHAEMWCDRNRRPMGLFHAFAFLSRAMNSEEIEYHHFDNRLCYHQYEDWDKLLYAEQQECELLDEENEGAGTAFLAKLKSLREKYPLAGKPLPEQEVRDKTPAMPEITTIILQSDQQKVLADLIAYGNSFKAGMLSTAMEIEGNGYQRKAVLVALTGLYRNIVLEEPEKKELTLEGINRKVMASKLRTRKNFVRRVYRQNKLFAMSEICQHYLGYTEEMLLKDLAVKSKKVKRKKHKPSTDLRSCQLEKLAAKLRYHDLDESQYHRVCNTMVMLQNAHNHRLPIPLTVKLGGEALVYEFYWKTREQVVKSFVELANSKGMTHELLKQKHQEITSSGYSF
ncbi:hypothetical protein J7E50_02955 [Pedobacter sp. ISL-68]|uniref:hypothetical protein n=1 Tax=unclassified Pedobacter TaxID=2628915 RepID=UPI001BE639C1|nr:MULTISPECIES: hypothetical protein [unclassified Pedobacter]MBT2560180.1 hypothetical protein [Pedobacter sp. ISL-64]MBT2589159.1 hypothetical protein [Pedobacter sp. ISL-68]